jgi:hypothetical protein
MWMIEKPRVKVAISARNQSAGLCHLKIEVKIDDELGDLYDPLEDVGGSNAKGGRNGLMPPAI